MEVTSEDIPSTLAAAFGGARDEAVVLHAFFSLVFRQSSCQRPLLAKAIALIARKKRANCEAICNTEGVPTAAPGDGAQCRRARREGGFHRARDGRVVPGAGAKARGRKGAAGSSPCSATPNRRCRSRSADPQDVGVRQRSDRAGSLRRNVAGPSSGHEVEVVVEVRVRSKSRWSYGQPVVQRRDSTRGGQVEQVVARHLALPASIFGVFERWHADADEAKGSTPGLGAKPDQRAAGLRRSCPRTRRLSGMACRALAILGENAGSTGDGPDAAGRGACACSAWTRVFAAPRQFRC